jgi:predicted metal-dependent hydrolase
MNQEYVQSNGFIAEVIRTNRVKSADIKVEDCAVSVVVPSQLPVERIERLLKDKNKWIKEKLILQREAQPVSSKDYVSGEAFSYLGRNYRLKVNQGKFQPVKLKQGRLVVTVPDKQAHMIRNALIRWYKHHAQVRLQDKVNRYAKIVGIDTQSIGVKSFKSRWGSCLANGHIDFNWKIIMAPHHIVDYVVVHELCHLKQHDHSPKFWKLVEQVVPDYADCKQWLKDNERLFKL